MGIRYLGKFMNQNKVLEKICLRDTRLIVDGNNLCHKLMETSGRGNMYGGNYDLFSTHVEHFFFQLQKCGLSPYIVMDGAYDADDKKFRCLLERCNKKIWELTRGKGQSRCFPILSYRTFTQTLMKLKVPVVTCAYEADREIAVLAKLWQCPVLSDDNDFYVFSLPGGVIRFADLSNYSASNTEKTYINTMIYYSKNVKSALGICPSMLPLLAALTNNDYFTLNRRTLELFISHVQVISPRKAKYKAQKQLDSIVETLCYLKNLSEATAALKHCLHVDCALSNSEKERALTYVDIVVNHFNLEMEGKKMEGQIFGVGGMANLDSTKLPIWLIESIKSCHVSPLIVNVSNGKVILKPNLEDLYQPYLQDIASSLRQTIYKMVLDRTPNQHFVNEYFRTITVMSQAKIYPTVEFDPFFTLDQIMEECDATRRALMSTIFEMSPENLAKIPEDSKLFVLCLNYFTKNSYLKESAKGQKCLLFCHMLLVWKEVGDLYGNIIEEKGKHMISIYTSKNKDSTSDIQLIHELQRFQAVMDIAYDINGILRFPIPVASPTVMYNGSLMYSLFTETENEAQLDSIIETCLRKGTELEKIFVEIYSVLSGA